MSTEVKQGKKYQNCLKFRNYPICRRVQATEGSQLSFQEEHKDYYAYEDEKHTHRGERDTWMNKPFKNKIQIQTLEL